MVAQTYAGDWVCLFFFRETKKYSCCNLNVASKWCVVASNLLQEEKTDWLQSTAASASTDSGQAAQNGDFKNASAVAGHLKSCAILQEAKRYYREIITRS